MDAVACTTRVPAGTGRAEKNRCAGMSWPLSGIAGAGVVGRPYLRKVTRSWSL